MWVMRTPTAFDTALAIAAVSIFVISTFGTDFVFLKDRDVDQATDALGNVRRSPIQHVYVGDGDAGTDPAAARLLAAYAQVPFVYEMSPQG